MWLGPLTVTKIINKVMIKVTETNVNRPRWYVAHLSKILLAKKFGQKDVDPLFQLPRLPVEMMKTLEEELSEFKIPARSLHANDLVDEFPSSVIPNQRGQDKPSSTVSKPLSVLQSIESLRYSENDRSVEVVGSKQP